MDADRTAPRTSWPAGLLVFALGLFIVLLSLGAIETTSASSRPAVFKDPRHWQLTAFGLMFACAGLLLAIPQRAQLLGRFVAMVFLMATIAGGAGTIWYMNGGAARQRGGSMSGFLDAMASWFQSFGVHPVLGAFVLGAAIAFCFAYRRNPGSGAEAGMAEPGASKTDRLVKSSSLRVENTKVAFEVNGKPVDMPAEVIAQVRAGNKVEAIKALRHACGLDLAEAKHVVDMLAESPLGRG